MKKIKVKKEDKEVDMNSGLVEINFEAVLVKDYEHKWEDAAIWKFLRGIYDRYIVRSRIDKYEDKVKEEVEELIAQMKSFLAIEAKS
jgi:cytochrome P450